MHEPTPDPHADRPPTGLAWWSFVIGAVVTAWIVWSLTHGHDIAFGPVFLLAVAWAVVAVPVALVARGHVLQAAWQSRPADPGRHHRGLIFVWAALEIGIVLALLAAAFSGSLLPGGLLAAVLFMGLLALRPGPHALAAGRRA